MNSYSTAGATEDVGDYGTNKINSGCQDSRRLGTHLFFDRSQQHDKERTTGPSSSSSNCKSSAETGTSGLPTPKRPMNAYNFFYKEQREFILGRSTESYDEIANGYTIKKKRCHQKTHGVITLVELAKTVGKMWRNLSENEMEKYRALALKDGERYKRDLALYKELSKQQETKEKELDGVESGNNPAASCGDSRLVTKVSNKLTNNKKRQSSQVRALVRRSKKRKKCTTTTSNRSHAPTVSLPGSGKDQSGKIEKDKGQTNLPSKEDLIPLQFAFFDEMPPSLPLRNVPESILPLDPAQLNMQCEALQCTLPSMATPYSLPSDVPLSHPTFLYQGELPVDFVCQQRKQHFEQQQQRKDRRPSWVEPVKIEEMQGHSMEAVERSLCTILRESGFTFGL